VQNTGEIANGQRETKKDLSSTKTHGFRKETHSTTREDGGKSAQQNFEKKRTNKTTPTTSKKKLR